jgi:type II secretory pathway component HofQ
MLKLLVQALGDALPGPERWERVWTRLAFSVDRSDPARPALRVTWPDVPPRAARAHTGHAIAVDFKDSDLNDVFRLFADITKLNVVVHPGSQGRVTLQVAEKLPWDEALDLVLAPNGLAYLWEGNVIRIGRPQQVGVTRSASGAGARRWAGAPINLLVRDTDLREVLAKLAQEGGVRMIGLDPAIQGRVTLKLDAVPWDQAFDIVLSVNNLEWSREGDLLTVKRTDRGTKPAANRQN